MHDFQKLSNVNLVQFISIVSSVRCDLNCVYKLISFHFLIWFWIIHWCHDLSSYLKCNDLFILFPASFPSYFYKTLFYLISEKSSSFFSCYSLYFKCEYCFDSSNHSYFVLTQLSTMLKFSVCTLQNANFRVFLHLFQKYFSGLKYDLKELIFLMLDWWKGFIAHKFLVEGELLHVLYELKNLLI